MSEKKHIDRLFQENFKNFEVSPDDNVWSNIESTLNKKKKTRKVIPFWFKLAGVAAALLLLFTIGNKLVNNTTQKTPSKDILVDTETKKSENINLQIESSKNNKGTKSNSIEKIATTNSKLKTESDKSNIINSSQKTIIKAKASNVTAIDKNKKQNKVALKNNLNTIYKTNKNTVVTNKNIKSKIDNSNSNNTNTPNSLDIKTTKELIKNKKENNFNVLTNSKEQKNIEPEELDAIKEATTVEKEGDKQVSLLEEVAEINIEKEEIIEEEGLKNRWNVMPNIAPVYFNTLGKGSSIHNQFSNNDKSGTINMSYGITASYNVTKKLSVRTGVNKMKVGYNTKNVIIYQTTSDTNSDEQPIKSINFNIDAQSISIISANNFAFTEVPNIFNNTLNTSLDQRLGFIEVPLELAYKISDKKLGISVVGGVSALFLNENEIYSTLNGNSTLLGKANNINNTSFSANFGLGLDYKLSNNFNLNLEPIFKYQMNTFNNVSGDFKPFVIGIYTGLSFKF